MLLVTVPQTLFAPDVPWTAAAIWACFLLFFLGTSAGLFSVPLEAYLQHRSPRDARGSVLGHTDRSGSDKYNNALSMRRAQAVASRMQALGIAASALAVAAKGESEPKVETPDGERNPTNRRVEVTAAN